VKLWKVRCTRCGVIGPNRPAALADAHAARHRRHCEGTVVVERHVK
jgi:hypothetical protein